MSDTHRRYRGHRARSFHTTDMSELVELRARQRTFHGAYSRSAMGNLGYALTILRLFDHRFYKVGLLFAILGCLLFIIAFLRSRHSQHDFADPQEPEPEPQTESPETEADGDSVPIQTVGQENTRVFGRPFITAGWIVLAVSGVVTAVEIGLLVLILQI
ncbi:uncharacterized protein EV420DRAFT_1621180 [Desarmillaria tabescens]|uniref:DUF202 domain-containing protein n=1 Tax=Armillaria tabescens TaxID=1929756 RepID=A0AA39K9M7_ARMTA|nr:uncharacterized protein EV420DRAFT_1621180 [Desarmillaria tabescens]KAK0457124.1 hypothetical protein EV420DRAFT_1621180 [Desarmillaria tabescens]